MFFRTAALVVTLAATICLQPGGAAESTSTFRWVNKLAEERTPLVRHGTFASQANGCQAGYYIYLPPGYDEPANAKRRYPVVYYLHGGRPGGEHKSISMAPIFDEAMRAGRVPPMIYVFVNGGAMSHYDYPALKSYGETAFVKELIPHIDATFRTIAKREGRGLEGFSQGGRGTGRIMFKYPELFFSCAPMGGGHQHEKHAAENGGRETSGTQFEPGNNTYDLARAYVAKEEQWPLRVFVAFGAQDFNYEANLDWCRHLRSLGIDFVQKIAGQAPHSAQRCYQNLGDEVMLFHAGNFKKAVAAVSKRPNLLLITADDLGLQLGCYGGRSVRTPNLDALAARACVFDNAYVAQASCSPSRSAMFTGLYPHANGQYGLVNAGVGFALHPALRSQTIPNLLKNAGYRTAILGKLHVAPEESFAFDTRIKADTRKVKAAAEAVGEFIRGGEKPFFLMANFADPHVISRSPRPPNEAFATQVEGVPEKPLRAGEVPAFPFQQIETDEQLERVAQYGNAVMRLDAGVGLLLDELGRAGRNDDTVILFVSDHGPPFVRGKTSCYEGGVKVPMMAAWPAVFAGGARSAALVSTVDLLPTLLDAAGLDAPAGLHGRSLRNTLDPGQHREFLATEFHYHGASPFFPRRSIRDARFKLIHNLRAGQVMPAQSIDGDAAMAMARSGSYPGTRIGKAFERAANPPEYELYDLQADPWEFDDLAALPEHERTLRRLKDALLQWRRETDDPLLTPDGFAKVAAYEAAAPAGDAQPKRKPARK